MYQDLQAHQMKFLTVMVARLLKMENPESLVEDGEMEKFFGDMFLRVLGGEQWLDEGGENLSIPSLYFGCEPPAEKKDTWHKNWVQELHTMAEDQEGAEVYQFDKYSTHFEGIKLNVSTLFKDAKDDVGKKIEKEIKQGLVDELGVDVEGALGDALKGNEALLKEVEDQEVWNRLITQWEKLEFIIVVGEVDGHLVVFMGKDANALVLVDEVENSLAGRPEFEYVGNAQLLGAWYASETLLNSFQAWKGYEKVYRALAQAFTKEELPNSEKIVADLKALADLEHQLVERKADDYMFLFMLDNGVRIESIGGRHDVDLDFSQPLRLPAVADSLGDDLFFNVHWRGNQPPISPPAQCSRQFHPKSKFLAVN